MPHLVKRRHPHARDIDLGQEVEICTECGIVFVHKPHRLGQCPLGHDQETKEQ